MSLQCIEHTEVTTLDQRISRLCVLDHVVRGAARYGQDSVERKSIHRGGDGQRAQSLLKRRGKSWGWRTERKRLARDGGKLVMKKAKRGASLLLPRTAPSPQLSCSPIRAMRPRQLGVWGRGLGNTEKRGMVVWHRF